MCVTTVQVKSVWCRMGSNRSTRACSEHGITEYDDDDSDDEIDDDEDDDDIFIHSNWTITVDNGLHTLK